MSKSLFILGAGGHGIVVADAAKKMNKWKHIFFLDDNLIGKEVLGLQIIDEIKNINNHKKNDHEFIVGIGNNLTRQTIQEKLESDGYNIATVIHPFTSISESSEIGQGAAILAGVVINPLVIIGKGCIINTSCSVDHESKIFDFVHLSPGSRIAGTVSVGERTWIGTNSTVINNVKIRNDVIIGAGSLVLKDIIEMGTYVGSPVKKSSIE